MTSSFPEHLVVLAAVALLGAVAALAVVERSEQAASTPPLTSAAAPAGWNSAFAGSRGPVGDAQRTTCGQVLTPESLGVTHAVLPCGTKIVLRLGGTQVLTEVIDNKLVEPGRQLEVTEKLARILHLEDTTEIDWRFATEVGG